jgi:hypothetical protein
MDRRWSILLCAPPPGGKRVAESGGQADRMRAVFLAVGAEQP